MAESKNNRRKKKKRTQNHRAPVLPPTKEEIAQAEAEEKEHGRMLVLNIVSFALMIAGFVIAQMWSHFFGYPISFIGSIMGIFSTRVQEKGRMVTLVCYTIFAVLVAFAWLYELIYY